MIWIILAIIIFFCLLLSKIEDYSYFNFDEEAIFIGKRKIVKINYKAIKRIDRSLMSSYESDVRYINYYFYYQNEKGHEVKSCLKMSFRDIEKWARFKKKLLNINPNTIINETILFP